MRTPIPPALTAAGWQIRQLSFDDGVGIETDSTSGALRVFYPTDGGDCVSYVPTERLLQLIALSNAALPDSDDRKITRQWVDEIRFAAEEFKTSIQREYGPKENWGHVPHAMVAQAERVIQYTRALESYLPPSEK